MQDSPSPVTLKPGDSVFLPLRAKHSVSFGRTGLPAASMVEPPAVHLLVMVMPGTGTDKMFADLDTACRNCPDQKQLMAEVGRICENCGVQFA